MPITIRKESSGPMWVMEVGEILTLADIGQAAERAQGDPCRSYLWDLRAMVDGPASFDEFRTAGDVVERTAGSWGGGRLAVVIARKDDEGLADAFGGFARNARLAYFVTYSYDEAVRFLSEPDEDELGQDEFG